MSQYVLRRRQALALGAAAMAVPRLGRAQATAWPSQPVRMVVPFAAGGPTDVPARLLADEMSKALPHRIVVENRTDPASWSAPTWWRRGRRTAP